MSSSVESVYAHECRLEASPPGGVHAHNHRVGTLSSSATIVKRSARMSMCRRNLLQPPPLGCARSRTLSRASPTGSVRVHEDDVVSGVNDKKRQALRSAASLWRDC
eukprot:13393-Amphidinium_carterae.2